MRNSILLISLLAIVGLAFAAGCAGTNQESTGGNNNETNDTGSGNQLEDNITIGGGNTTTNGTTGGNATGPGYSG